MVHGTARAWWRSGSPARSSAGAAACGDGRARSNAAGRAQTSHAPCRRLPTENEALTPDPDQPPAVARHRVTLVDPSRATPALPNRPASSCRVLADRGPIPARVSGPLPLVVVAHGLDGDPSTLAPLLDTWAAAGYVVVAPRFPTTSKDSDGVSLPSESVDQAADMSFVIDQMLARSGPQAAGFLRGAIDPRHIGVAGMSLGGLSVYGLISNTCCRDRRVTAAILMAAVRRQFPDDRYEDNEVPVLVVQGDADTGYHNSREGYPELVPPKWFITLHGSGHSPPFEVPPGTEAPFVYATTTWFWDRYLKGDAVAAQRITRRGAASHGKATLQRDLR